ncbi:MAG: transglutaminase-like domain-containing protein, partial [Pseudomonadota bacterium]
VKDLPQFDFAAERRVVFDWVRRNIRFVRDIEGKETLRTAREILTVRAGDCDDINGILLPSLLGTIGHRCRLVTISSHPQAPEVFSHIYAEVYDHGRWIPVDAARRDPRLGRAPAHFIRKRVWSLSSDDFRDVAGLGYYTPRMAYAPIGPRVLMGQPFDPRRRYLTGYRRLGFDWGQFAVQMSQATANIIQSLGPRLPAGASYVQPAAPPPPPPPAQLPPWLLPAGIGLGVLFLMRNR